MNAESHKCKIDISLINKRKNHISNFLENHSLIRMFLYLALPLLIVFITNYLMMFVNTTLMIKYNPELDVASIQGVAKSYWRLYFSVASLTFMGALINYAITIGKGHDDEKVSKTINQSLTFVFIFSFVIFGIFTATYSSYINGVANVNSESKWTQDTIDQSVLFFYLVSGSSVLVMIRNVYLKVLWTEGNVISITLLQILLEPIYCVLGWVFLGPCNMGPMGMGVAYLVSSTINIIAIYIFIRIRQIKNETHINFKLKSFGWNNKVIIKILIFGLPAALLSVGHSLQDVLDSSIFYSFEESIGSLHADHGEDTSSFYSAFESVSHISIYITSAMTSLVSTFVGYYMGAKDRLKVKKLMRQTFYLFAALNIVCVSALFGASTLIFSIFEVTNVDGHTWTMWSMFILSMCVFGIFSYMTIFLNTIGKTGTLVIQIIISFFVISISLQTGFYFLGKSMDNVFYYSLYKPIWVCINTIYLFIVYRIALNEFIHPKVNLWL